MFAFVLHACSLAVFDVRFYFHARFYLGIKRDETPVLLTHGAGTAALLTFI